LGFIWFCNSIYKLLQSELSGGTGMSLFENESFKRILTRFKKLFFILLLLPLILACLGYFLEMNQETTSKAKAAIMLGEYPSTEYDYTDVGTVQVLLKNEKYLKKLNSDFEKLAGKTEPMIQPGKVIELSYAANNSEKAEKVLKELVDAFLIESNKSYKERKRTLENKIQTTENEEVLYVMNTELEKLRPAQIHKEVTVDETKNNPMRRAILGFLIGTMFSISILLAPEVFRK
jgi:teichuronic acid biosynthesis protein TuaF